MSLKLDVPVEWRCKHDHGIRALPPLLCWQCTADDAFLLYDRVNMAYRKGQPVMEDNRFDVLEAYLRGRHPFDQRFHKVGETS